MAYTVQNAPLHLKLIYSLYGWILAALWYSLSFLWRSTLRIRFEGEENLQGRPNSIYVFWHENLAIYFLVFLRIKEKQIWMQHPLLFMKPIHIMLKWMGVKELAYGSSGHNGKAALERVEQKVRDGYSTVLTPDGPRGPSKEMKPGPLILAANTGVPAVPVTYSCSKAWVLNTWDKKIVPKPFSKVVVRYHEPVYIRDPESDRLIIPL